MNNNGAVVKILEDFWPRNKAKGLLAQSVLAQEINKNTFGTKGKEKIMSGCWLLAPKGADFYKFRFCFFIHPRVIKSSELSKGNFENFLGDFYRPFHALAEFMNNAGVGVIYAMPLTKNGQLPLEEISKRSFENIEWGFFSFENGSFIPKNSVEFFGRWEGDRGRPSYGGNWDETIKEKIKKLDTEVLTELLLNELFYTGFIKSALRKPLNDPYDVDSFLLSMSQKHIFPMEVKEKFAFQNGREKFFGIDAGRIMMLLRLCLPNDSNAVYLIREVDEQSNFVGWKYITLSDIIMTSSWNLQAGGLGMGGQSTQTIRLPYAYFKKFDESAISDDNLKNIGNLPRDIKTIARDFGLELSSKFHK